MTLQEPPLKSELNPLEDRGARCIDSWVSEAPLKLVAWALESTGRTAKTVAIREKITSNVVQDFNWKTWWRRVLPAVKESRHFSVRSNNSIRLMAKLDDIPARRWEHLPSPAKKPRQKSPSVGDWRAWFLNPTPEPPPARWPTKAAYNALTKLPTKDITPALERTMWGAGEFLASDSLSGQAATAWMESVSRAFVRFRDLEDLESVSSGARSVAELLARLVIVARFTTQAVECLVSTGSFSNRPCVWQQGFAAGMWRAMQGAENHTSELPRALLAHVEPPSRTELARDLILGALLGPDPTREHFKLDRLLDQLSVRDRAKLILELMVRAGTEDSSADRLRDYIANSRYVGRLSASDGQRLDVLVIASLLLTDGSGPIVRQASQEIREVLASPSGRKQRPIWRGLLTEAEQHIDDLRREHRIAVRDLQSHYESQLEDSRRQKEELTKQVQSLRSQIAAGREESKLDIRQDMLTVIADTLQSLRRWQDSEDRVAHHVEARLILALRAGGAEEFGVVGEKSPYNPAHHQASTEITVDSPVRVSAPGAIVRGSLTGDRILVKALVEEV